MNIKIGIFKVPLIITKAGDLLEPHLRHQTADVAVAQREHVEVIDPTITEGIAEARQSFIYMLGTNFHIFSAIDIAFALSNGRSTLQQPVVIAVIKNQDAIVLQHGVILSQSFTPVPLLEQVGE